MRIRKQTLPILQTHVGEVHENAVDGGTVGCTCKVKKCDSNDA